MKKSVEKEIKTGLPRVIDLTVAAVGLIICAPVIAIAAITIAMTSRGPAFFRQKRVGRFGRPFTLYKLRTMRVANSGPQVTAGRDTRITFVGRILRKTKIDELPELWNVIKGEMSLVGPRPEVLDYVALEDPRWKLVLTARPGITDPMTLRLRNEEELLSNVECDRVRFYLDVLQPYKLKGYAEYIENRSWFTDLGVLVKTAIAVIFPAKALPPTVNEIIDTVGISDSAIFLKTAR